MTPRTAREPTLTVPSPHRLPAPQQTSRSSRTPFYIHIQTTILNFFFFNFSLTHGMATLISMGQHHKISCL